MRLSAVVLGGLALLSLSTLPGAADPAPVRVSGPLVHENLAVYFVRGPSNPGPVPLTLEEALRAGSVKVFETGRVNSLQIENFSDQPVFIQAGDIVKGGRQDRTLTTSLLLPPKSGRVPIASFCVEHGRWSGRGREDAKHFASAATMVPSRDIKLAMQAPLAAQSHMAPSSPYAETAARQQQVWAQVRAAQSELSRGAGTDVRAQNSASSLQLSLENEKLLALRRQYVKALQAAGGKDDDIIGYVFAVNGKLNSGDVYMSNALFRKMWPKLLAASAVEALGRRREHAGDMPTAKAVSAFLKSAKAGKTSEQRLDFGMRRVMHAASGGYMIEADAPSGWVHRSYLTK